MRHEDGSLKSAENVVTAIGDPDNGPEDSFIVSVYPNPATGWASLEYSLPQPMQVRLEVFEERDGIFKPRRVVEFERDIEREVLPYCKARTVGILPYCPLAGGFLTGKYRRGQAAPPRGSSRGGRQPSLGA